MPHVGQSRHLGRYNYRRRQPSDAGVAGEKLHLQISHCTRLAADWPSKCPLLELWAATLEQCFVREHDRCQRLRVALGPWTAQPKHWKWFFIPSQDRLVEQTDEASWIQYERTSGAQTTRHQGFRRTFHRLLQLPLEAQPTSIFGRQTLRMRGSAAILPKPAEDPIQWWYEILEAPTNHAGILQGIHDGTALWVADGSYKTPYGTAAFTLLPTLYPTTGITLVNQTPDRRTDQDAYRAEAAGIYGSKHTSQ
jgi:hypothetical protein